MLLLVLTLAVFMPVSANAAPKINQWVNKGRYRYYYNQKGKKVKNKVKQIGKFRYSFDKKGRMQTGWQIFGSKKAYFSKKSGRMQVNKKSRRCQDRKKWLCKTEQDGAEGTESPGESQADSC